MANTYIIKYLNFIFVCPRWNYNLRVGVNAATVEGTQVRNEYLICTSFRQSAVLLDSLCQLVIPSICQIDGNFVMEHVDGWALAHPRIRRIHDNCCPCWHHMREAWTRHQQQKPPPWEVRRTQKTHPVGSWDISCTGILSCFFSTMMIMMSLITI